MTESGFAPPEEGKTFAAAFPFVMVLTSVFLEGFTFFLVNWPLLRALIAGYRGRPLSVVREVLVPAWAAASTGPGDLTPLAFLVVVSMVIGFPIQKLAAAHADVWARLGNRFSRAPRFFSSIMYTWTDHSKLAVGLHANRALKSAWEWNLFRYWVDWGLATNALLFFVLTLALSWPDPWLLVAMAVWLLTSFSALPVTQLMYDMHCYARRTLGLQK